MESFENFVRGSVRIEVVGLDVENFLNLCTRYDLPFWDLRRTAEGAFQMSFALKNWKRAQLLAEKAMCEARLLRAKGVPALLGRVKARFVLLAGLLACVLGVAVLSMFIWEIDIVGESKLPDSVIRSALEANGVGMGTFGLSVDSELLRSKMLLELPELKWLSVNVYGSRAVVSVRDRTEPPAIVDRKTPGDIVAGASGLIERMEVYAGQPLVRVGSTVLAGEKLVTGTLTSQLEQQRQVHSLAEIQARTWYKLSAQMPLEAGAKAYTGEEFTRRALYIGGKRLNLYLDAGIPLDGYDKISRKSSLTVFDSFTFPFSMTVERYRAYEYRPVELDAAEAEAILQQGLLRRLEQRMDKTGQIVDYSFETREENGVCTVTLQAECLENIAVEVPVSDILEEDTGA